MTRNISAWAIRKPIPTIVLFVVLTFAGMAAFMRLPINANPNVSFPIVTVTVTQASAAPAELETQVTRRVEGTASGLPGVNHIRSTISTGVSTTTVEFKIGTDPDRATTDVREAVTQIRSDLPQSIQEPVISRVDVDGSAILYYTIRAPRLSPVELSWFVDDTVNRELLAVPGVQKVQRLGGVNREIRVSLDPDKLLALGVTADQVNSTLRDMNANIPGGRGTIGGREQAIRALGSVKTVEELSQLSVPLPGNRWVRLADIATVADTSAEPRSFARLDGEQVVGFSVSRAKGYSDTTVAEAAKGRIAEIQARTPDIEMKEMISTVQYTMESYDAASTALVEGAILTVVVVFLFLRNWRATLISALAMPLSILPTFAIMALLGFTLNSISLLALTLVIGILVDDAIVEIENIERHIHMGKRPYIASIEAADAIGLAVVATTLTIVAVFAPVSFIGGAVGQYFKQFGLTVAIAVLFSLLVARLLTPLMAAYLMQPAAHPTHADAAPSTFSAGYLKLLGWTLDHRKTALGIVAVIFAGSLGLLTLLPTGFLPTSDGNLSQVKVTLPPGTRLPETESVTDGIVKQLMTRPEVEAVLATSESVNEANLLIRLTPRSERKLNRKSFEMEVRPILAATPDIQFTFLSDGGGKEVSIYLVGEDAVQLSDAARKLEMEMRGLPQLANVLSTEPPLAPELIVKPRPDEAARLGVSSATLGTVARIATLGETDANSAQFNLGNRQVPIRVMLDTSARADLETLRKLRVSTSRGKMVPLTSVADISFGAEEGQAERLNRKRLVAIEANLNGVTLGTAMAAIAELPAYKQLPAGVTLAEYGDAEYMAEMFRNFALAVLGGVLMVAAVLMLLFKDFLQPVTILIALPLSLGGAALALLLAGSALDLSSTIGILMLMGIVGKNSILLVDYAIEARREGLDRRAALLKAGTTRARPIIMTTIAMVAGMVPAAIGVGADAGFRAPMAIAVIGGLITSTLLSLVFVPVMFTVMDDLKNWLARRLKPLTSVTEADRLQGELLARRQAEMPGS